MLEEHTQDVRIAMCFGQPQEGAHFSFLSAQFKKVLQEELPLEDQFNRHPAVAEAIRGNPALTETALTENDLCDNTDVFVKRVRAVADLVWLLEQHKYDSEKPMYRPILVCYFNGHGSVYNDDARFVQLGDGSFFPLSALVAAFGRCERSLKFFLIEACANDRGRLTEAERMQHMWPIEPRDVPVLPNSVFLLSASNNEFYFSRINFSTIFIGVILQSDAAGKTWEETLALTFDKLRVRHRALGLPGVGPEMRTRLKGDKRFCFVTQSTTSAELPFLGQSVDEDLPVLKHEKTDTSVVRLIFPAWIRHAESCQITVKFEGPARPIIPVEPRELEGKMIHDYALNDQVHKAAFSYCVRWRGVPTFSGWSRDMMFTRPPAPFRLPSILTLVPPLILLEGDQFRVCPDPYQVPVYMQTSWRQHGDWIGPNPNSAVFSPYPQYFKEFKTVSPPSLLPTDFQVRVGSSGTWSQWSAPKTILMPPVAEFQTGHPNQVRLYFGRPLDRPLNRREVQYQFSWLDVAGTQLIPRVTPPLSVFLGEVAQQGPPRVELFYMVAVNFPNGARGGIDVVVKSRLVPYDGEPDNGWSVPFPVMATE